jgi:hypothetical protein
MSYTKIASFTASGGETDAVFSTVPSTFKHLVMQGFVRSNTATTDMVVQFNGDTSTNSYVLAQSNNNALGNFSVGHYAPGDIDGTRLADYIPNSGSDWCGFTSYFTDYLSTSKTKNIISLSNNAYAANQWMAGAWLGTAAVNAIRVRMSGTFIAGSKLVLYGLAG